MKTKLFLLLAALLCATANWATDYNVGNDSELRAARSDSKRQCKYYTDGGHRTQQQYAYS